MQITNGIFSVLSNPNVYNFFQNIVGSERARQVLIADYVKLNGRAKLLDIGCGTGEILKFLPNNIDYHGYDLSPRYIEYAKKKYGKLGNFYCADATNISLDVDEKFDRVIAFGLLHHLDDQEVFRLCSFVKNILKPGGQFITYDNCYTPTQSKISRYIISKDRGQNVRTPKGYQALAEQIFNNIQVDVREDLLRIPYTNIIMSCS